MDVPTSSVLSGSFDPTPNQMIQLASEANHKAFSSVFHDLFKQRHSILLRQGKYNFLPDVKDTLELIAQDTMCNKPLGYFITINPSNDCDRDLFKDRFLEIFLGKKWVREGIYGFELTKDGHYHVHCYVRYADIGYAHVLRETFSTFKSFCATKKHVHVKRVATPIHETNVVQYCVKDLFDVGVVGSVFSDVLPKNEVQFILS